MKSLQKLLDFYIFSNIHVGIATACLVVLTHNNVALTSITNTAYFVFFITVFAYHFIRIFDSKNYQHCECNYKGISTFLQKQSVAVQVVGLFSLLGTFYFAYFVGMRYLWVVLPAAFITFWYAIPLFKYKGNKISLRNYPLVKILSIALVWAIMTVLFPLQEFLDDKRIWLEFVQRFFLIMALIIPFDIRDLNQDEAHLHTLPQKIGIVKSKLVGVLFLVIFFGLSFLKTPLDSGKLIVELIVFILVLFFLVKSKEIQSKYFASFWVESVPIIWIGLIWVLQLIL